MLLKQISASSRGRAALLAPTRAGEYRTERKVGSLRERGSREGIKKREGEREVKAAQDNHRSQSRTGQERIHRERV